MSGEYKQDKYNKLTTGVKRRLQDNVQQCSKTKMRTGWEGECATVWTERKNGRWSIIIIKGVVSVHKWRRGILPYDTSRN